ncbi:MAG: tyrosine-protein phosphatase [Pseudomonadales bacterium]
MDGTPNFRDLGGYSSSCGRQVRYGRLFRSGVLSQLSDADLDLMDQRNIVTICDYRRAEELERDPTRLHSLRPPKIAHMPIDPGSKSSFFEQIDGAGSADAAPLDIDLAGFMVDINRAFVLEHHSSFKLMLNEMQALSDDQALLFHCAAGKDRTGFAAALILMCLNVPRETIIEDYMLTGQYFKPDAEIERMQKKYSEFGFDKIKPDLIRPMLEVREEFIEEAFVAIDEHFETTEQYLEKTFGLASPELEAMRARFLS